MECPECQFENDADAKFCTKCGSKLEIACPKCGKRNRLGSQFCKECGHNLTLPSEPAPKKLSLDEKIEKIQKYLPKGLTEKILAQKDRIEGERKRVTVMFCDMEHYSQLSERLGPEKAYDTVDQIYELLIQKVHDYEGTVNEMTGDGIVALFGAPIALEDAPQRALRSAMSIHREMSRLSDRLKQEREYLPTLKMRIGIHTGLVVVGTVGNNLRVEFKAVGDTVNLASRMEGLAQPGATYVTEDTFKLTEGLFRFEALGEKEVKGKKEPVSVYRVIAPSTRKTRFDVSAERGLTPFVGREREVDLLLDAFVRVKAGRGQAISIMSEAGVGKSRLLYEFRKAVVNEDVTFLEGKCLSYSRGVAYHPITDILKSNFDVLEGDGDAEIREKVKRGLKILGLDETSTLPYFLELLSVRDSGVDKIMMSPEGRKDQINEALKRIVLRGSEIRPLVMAFEDLHWTDNSSEEVLRYVLESIPGARVLLIFTYRPEFVHTWSAKSYHNQLTISRLSNRESLTMVCHLLETENIDRNLEELILEKAEGVLFFIEEFIRSLKDLKIIERKDNKYNLAKGIERMTIPSTIQDVIMARVDSLSEGAKELLQTGSVVEREFSYQLIKRVTGLSEQELLSNMSALKDSELLYERGIYPQGTYIFKHAVTQEVVYDSILTKRRKKLHEKIGYVIEDLNKNNIEQYSGILAEHFFKSENYEKGGEYSKLAGRVAQKKSAFNDAISYANKRIICLERLAKTEATQKKIIDARTVLSGYYLALNYHLEANEAVVPIVDLALRLNYHKRLPAIYTAIGTYLIFFERDFEKGVEYLTKAIKLSEQKGDFVSLWFACYFLGCYFGSNCDFEKGLNCFKKSIDLSLTAKNLVGLSSAKSTMSAFNLIYQGKIGLAHRTSDESLQIANESCDIFAQSIAYVSHGITCYYKGLFRNAESSLLEGLAFSKKSSHAVWQGWGSLFLGELYHARGLYGKAENNYRKAIEYFLDRGKFLPSFKFISRLSILKSKALNNDPNIELSNLFEYYNNVRVESLKGWAARCVSEILLNFDDESMSEAENWIKKAIEADNRNGTIFELACDYGLHSELLKRKGDISRAKEKLAKSIDILKECSANGWVDKYEKELELQL